MSTAPNGSLVPFAELSWNRGLPSPYYKKPSHAHLRNVVRKWTEEHIMPDAFEWEERGYGDDSKLKQAAKDGILTAVAGGAKIPEWWLQNEGVSLVGGIDPRDWDGFHDLIMSEEMSKVGGVGPGGSIMAGIGIGLPPIENYGSESLKRRIIPDLLRGEKRICLAITEPDAGSDVKNLSTTAYKTSDGKYYVVNGTKKFITNGIWSDYFTTAVRTDPNSKPGEHKGVSLLVIPRVKGVTTKRLYMGGAWASGTTLITFNDVLVPAENLVGKENEGFKYIMANFNHERLGIAQGTNRLARNCIEDALSYAHEREVFGGKLIDLGVIRNKLGHMARLVECQTAWIESLVYQLEHLSKEEGDKLLGGSTALLKAHCTYVLHDVAREAVQIVGGIGYTRGGKAERIERIWRDLKFYAVGGGSEDMLDLGIREQVKLSKKQGAKL